MKTLIIVRHAKSTWKEKSLRDIDRPLKERGIKNAYEIAEILKTKRVSIDLMISSPATRAIQTAIIFSRTINYPQTQIRIDENLYSFGLQSVLEVIEGVSDSLQTVMIFGHDPAFTDLVNRLLSIDIENMVTSGTIKINFQCNKWSDVTGEKGKFDYYLKPKKEDSTVGRIIH